MTPAKITNRVPPDTTPVIEEEPTLAEGRTIQVEAAREGFDAEVVRQVSIPDVAEPRTLTLKSSYQPSRSVTLIGTGGRPPRTATGTPGVGSPTPVGNRPVESTPGGAPEQGAANATPGTRVPASSTAAPVAQGTPVPAIGPSPSPIGASGSTVPVAPSPTRNVPNPSLGARPPR